MNELMMRKYVAAHGLPAELFDIPKPLQELADAMEGQGVPRTAIDQLVMAAMGAAAANTMAYCTEQLSDGAA